MTLLVAATCVLHVAGRGRIWLGPDATDHLQEVKHCIAGMPGMW